MILFNVLLLISIGSVCSMPADRKNEKTEVTEANSEKEVTTEASKFKAYLKKYGDKDAKFKEKGYQRKSEDQGDDGYKHFDSFHKKNSDRYGYESHSSFGKSKKAEAKGGDAQIKYNDKDPQDSAESRYFFDVIDPWHTHTLPHFDIERIASLFHKHNHDAHEYIHSHYEEPFHYHDHDPEFDYHHGYKYNHELHSDDHDHYSNDEHKHEYEHPHQDDDHEYDHHPKYKEEPVYYHSDNKHHHSEYKHDQEHDKRPESEDEHECDHHPDEYDHTENNDDHNDDADQPPDDKNDQDHDDPHAIKDDHHTRSYFDKEQFFRDISNRRKQDDSKQESGGNGKAPSNNEGSEDNFADEGKNGDDNGKSDNH